VGAARVNPRVNPAVEMVASGLEAAGLEAAVTEAVETAAAATVGLSLLTEHERAIAHLLSKGKRETEEEGEAVHTPLRRGGPATQAGAHMYMCVYAHTHI